MISFREQAASLTCNTAEQYAALRALLRQHGIEKFQCELQADGWLDAERRISDGTARPNVFAQMVRGTRPIPYGDVLREHDMHAEAEQFLVTRNLPALNEHWQDASAEWLHRASMSRWHEFLLPRSSDRWCDFNVLTLGMDGDLAHAHQLLDQMQSTACEYAARARQRATGTAVQPPRTAHALWLGFHCYPLNSVQWLHMHMLDAEHTGPAKHALDYKNLSLDAVREVLRAETVH